MRIFNFLALLASVAFLGAAPAHACSEKSVRLVQRITGKFLEARTIIQICSDGIIRESELRSQFNQLVDSYAPIHFSWQSGSQVGWPLVFTNSQALHIR